LDVLSEGREKRVEPYFCLNFGTGTLDEALAWVEYCNGTKNTYYANLRRKNGREEPYNIKYWALGNEVPFIPRNPPLQSHTPHLTYSQVWGPWQVEQMTAEDYSKKASQWAKALKLLDPSLCLILCGETGHSSWDHTVLKTCIPFIDMHSIHIYTTAPTHISNAIAPLSAERAIETAAALIDIARIERNIPPSAPATKICFDEWNVWDPVRAPGEQGAEELYTLSDALAVGVWLNVFVRQSRYVGMANIAQTVNVISPLMTTGEGVVRQTTWWPLLLFSRYMRGWTIGAHVRAGAYEGETTPAWLMGTLENGASWLDVSAAVDEEGMVSLVVVNVNEQRDYAVDLTGVGEGEEVTVYTVTGPNVKSVNEAGKKPEVGLQETTWNGKGKFKFLKHSLTMLRWKTGQKVVEVLKGDGERVDTRKMAWS
jgi:alpha-N-arabinofuranosidase